MTPILPVMSVNDAQKRYTDVARFCQSVLVDGIDYGSVGSISKPALLKPGAEKLAAFFGLSARFTPLTVIQEWEGDEPLFFYRYKAEFYQGDVFAGEGIGSCNSREKRYRWRWVTEDEVPPNIDISTLKTRKTTISEFEFAINKAETSGKYGKPASYWQAFQQAIENGEARKTTRKFKSGEEATAWEITTYTYRIPNDGIEEVVNTTDKIAQKRAFIAGVLIICGVSEFFTQDIEDLDLGQEVVVEFSPRKAETGTETQPKAAPKSTSSKSSGSSTRKSTKSQTKSLNPKTLTEKANEEIGRVFYKSPGDVINMLDGVTGWPKAGDTQEWQTLLDLAILRGTTDTPATTEKETEQEDVPTNIDDDIPF